MLFLQISKYAPESCPLLDEKARKANDAVVAKMDQLTKKHGIKVVGLWTAMPEHMDVGVFDAPSMEALMKCSMEPEVMGWLAYCTTT